MQLRIRTAVVATSALAVRVALHSCRRAPRMRYPIMGTARDGDDERVPAVKRLRVPVSLIVAFLGSATAVSMSYGGCHTTTDPIDAGMLDNVRTDADVGDGGRGDGGDDRGDGGRDAAPADTPVV